MSDWLWVATPLWKKYSDWETDLQPIILEIDMKEIFNRWCKETYWTEALFWEGKSCFIVCHLGLCHDRCACMAGHQSLIKDNEFHVCGEGARDNVYLARALPFVACCLSSCACVCSLCFIDMEILSGTALVESTISTLF